MSPRCSSALMYCDWQTEGVFLHYLSTAAELGCRRANQFQAGIRLGCAKVSAGSEQFSSSPFVMSVRWRLVLNLPQWDYWGTRFDNRRHAAAKADTTGYARVFQRVSDSQPRGRRRTAVWCPTR